VTGPRRHPSNGLGLPGGPAVPDPGQAPDPLVAVKRRLHDALMRRVAGRGVESLHPAARRLLIREEALSVLREEGHLLPQEALARVVNDVSDRVVGLGPIESLLRDPEVSEGKPSTRGTTRIEAHPLERDRWWTRLADVP
jgi:pilus assembly protein CpaF